ALRAGPTTTPSRVFPRSEDPPMRTTGKQLGANGTDVDAPTASPPPISRAEARARPRRGDIDGHCLLDAFELARVGPIEGDCSEVAHRPSHLVGDDELAAVGRPHDPRR